jgi:hypothetical protein
MVKNVKEAPSQDVTPKSSKTLTIDDTDSQTIKEKKENAKKLQKAIKKVNAKVKASMEKKQIVKAIQALQEYQKKSVNQKKLLAEEDDYVQITFTLTEVPTKPTPRPL